MKIVYNKIIPFKGFSAVNIFGILFAREGANISERTIRHEKIHTYQQKEMLYLGFYLWYVLEWLIRVLFTKYAFSHSAYRSISFEQEAYSNQEDVDYVSKRKRYCWFNYITN